MSWIDNALGIHPKALTFRSQRSAVLAANIANSETPGFKAKDFDFKEVLKSQSKGLSLELTTTNKRHSGSVTQTEFGNVLYRVPTKASSNGNTVEPEVEQAAFSEKRRALSNHASIYKRNSVRLETRNKRTTLMGLTNTFRITGTALSAQSIHIDIIAKNMANAQVVSGNEADAFRAQRPVFASMLQSSLDSSGAMGSGFGNSKIVGVEVSELAESRQPIEKQRMPDNPMADSDGYVYLSNVNLVEEMAYMMQASRSYQSNIEVLNTSKQLMLRTLSLGNS